MTTSELERRLSEATGFDRELDRAIGFAIDGWKLVEVATPNPRMMLEIDGDIYPDHPGSMYPALTESFDEGGGGAAQADDQTRGAYQTQGMGRI